MKILITIILITAGAVLLVSCTAKDPATTEVVVLRDITQEHLAKPNADDILPLFDLNKQKWNGAIFRFADISDVSYSPARQAKIETAGRWLSNEFERDEEIKGFYGEVDKIITDTQNETIGRNNSSVYLSITREINRLSESKSQRKVILIYSDLMENEREMSFYNPRTLELLKTKPDEIQEYFETQLQLQSLNGIDIYLIYQPGNPYEDREYKIASEFYKKLFEKKGAKVESTANITF